MTYDERLLQFGKCIILSFRFQSGCTLSAYDAVQLVENMHKHALLSFLFSTYAIEVFATPDQTIRAIHDLTKPICGRNFHTLDDAQKVRLLELEFDDTMTFEQGMFELDLILGAGGRVLTDQADEDISAKATSELMEKLKCQHLPNSNGQKRNG